MNVYYQGSEGHIKSLGDNELQHFKYIKKIGDRYFYTPEALRAYYADQKKVATAEYAKDRSIDKASQIKRDAQLYNDYRTGFKRNSSEMKKQYDKEKRLSKAVYDAQGKYRSAKRVVKPVAKTAKRAVTPIKTPKERAMGFLEKNGANTASQMKKKKVKKMRKMSKSEAAYANYRRTHMSQKKTHDYQSRVRGA